MNGLKKAVAALGLVGLLSSPYFANKTYAQQPDQTVSQEQTQEPSLEQLAKEWNMPVSEIERIAQEMKQPVAETLKGYATPVCHDSYDREVFQKHLPKEQRKPVLVLFYLNEKHAKTRASQGLASVLKKLSEEFRDEAKFLSYDQDCDVSENQHDRYMKIRARYDIRAPPSIVMYAPFDLLKGETPARNDGRIKRVDTLRGGFDEIRLWNTFYDFLGQSWILTNMNDSTNYVWRFENSGQEKKFFLK